MGREVFFVFFLTLLCYEPPSSPTPPCVPDGVDRGLGWQGTPRPSPPPLFPTHSASLALHLLDLNGSWECCDVMHWCIERTAFLCFFFFPHPSAVPLIVQLYVAVSISPLLLTASFFLFFFPPVCGIVLYSVLHKSGVHQGFSEKKLKPVSQISCKVVHWGVRKGRPIHLWTETGNTPVLSGYFVLKDLFWQLPFKK